MIHPEIRHGDIVIVADERTAPFMLQPGDICEYYRREYTHKFPGWHGDVIQKIGGQRMIHRDFAMAGGYELRLYSRD